MSDQELNATVELKLTPDALTEIVRNHLETIGFKMNDASIEFNARFEIVGYGRGETQVPKFEGCIVKLHIDDIGVLNGKN